MIRISAKVVPMNVWLYKDMLCRSFIGLSVEEYDSMPRRFVMLPTGYDVPATYGYVASFTHSDGFVWTVFEVLP